jgi:Flp pilus assembly pilin Flp
MIRDGFEPDVTPSLKGKTMKIKNLFSNFCNDESGAVTVDWVVLTAAIVGLGMVVMSTVGGGITGLGDRVVTDLGTRTSGYGSTSTPGAGAAGGGAAATP